MPYPRSSSSRSSYGVSNRSVNPAAWSVGQKRLPGRPKWCPIAAVYSPGLIPQNSTRSPGAITSGTVLSRAARSSARVGARISVPEHDAVEEAVELIVAVVHDLDDARDAARIGMDHDLHPQRP